MIIDFHTHIFPSFIADHRTDFFSGESSFALLYDTPKSKLVGANELLQSMDTAGIQKSVVFGFPWKDGDLFRKHNDFILESVERFPRRLVGFCCVHPLVKGAAQEVERCLDAGMSGIGELAFYGLNLTPDLIRALEDIMTLARGYDVPLLIHTNEPVGHDYPGKTPMTLQQIYALVKTYPSNRIVLAHWGGGILFYGLMKKEVRGALKNVWFDTAASPYLYNPKIYQIAVDIVGVEKILFGSDYPLISPTRYFQEMSESAVSETSMKMITGSNAQHLLYLEREK
jgi:predicted TIM-barrel fold metal-dependent hydrolase